ncbi:MAG: NUDIX hydrolase [Spirochaetes bacterium]|nr:NUDIX hydrolase [Spirochaetota bacterium]
MLPKRISRKVIYENPWMNLYTDRVEFPGGRIVDEHHIIDLKNDSVGVILENDQQYILFVHAYRYVTGTIEWEIPAGVIDNDEDVIDAAIREVFEESGYTAKNAYELHSFFPMNGITDHRYHIVYATPYGENTTYDRNEIEGLRWISQDEINSMLREGIIKDGLTITAILLHQRLKLIS